MDKELEEIITKYKKCDKNIFSKYKDEILLLRKNCVTLKGILEYLFKKDEQIKKRYENRIDTALAYLSNTIQNWQKTHTPLKSKTKKTIPTNPIDVLNSNIYITDDEYKDLI